MRHSPPKGQGQRAQVLVQSPGVPQSVLDKLLGVVQSVLGPGLCPSEDTVQLCLTHCSHWLSVNDIIICSKEGRTHVCGSARLHLRTFPVCGPGLMGGAVLRKCWRWAWLHYPAGTDFLRRLKLNNESCVPEGRGPGVCVCVCDMLNQWSPSVGSGPADRPRGRSVQVIFRFDVNIKMFIFSDSDS